MKNLKILFSLTLIFIMLVTCFGNINASNNIDIPTIEMHCDNNIVDFLKAICDDIYKKSGKKFVTNYVSVGYGYHSNAYKLEGEDEDLCVKVFKPGLLRLTNGYNREHKHYYSVANQEYQENFLNQLKDPKLKNISLPIAAYKSETFFANISKFAGTLQVAELLKNQVVLDEEMTATIIYDILNGLHYLHIQNYSHSDLHPWNIVINFKDGKYLETNIIDCGNVSKKSGEFWESIASVTGYRFLRYINLLTLCSIWPYINLNTGYYDPQDLKCAIVDEKSDVFAVGVIMWELLFGSCPFAGCNLNEVPKSEAILKLNECLDWLRSNENISENCKDILLNLLAPTKSERISSSDALKHDFLKIRI